MHVDVRLPSRGIPRLLHIVGAMYDATIFFGLNDLIFVLPRIVEPGAQLAIGSVFTE